MSHKRIIGTRAEVWHGTAKKTSGGLTKSDLMMNKHGRIVSKAKYHTAKKEMRLVKHGYTAKKGQFGFVKVGSKKHRKGSKKMRGGYSMGGLNPASINSPDMMKMVVPQHFSTLDRALVGGKRRKGHKKGMWGGMVYGSALAPADVSAGDITGSAPMGGMGMGMGIDGQGITNYGMSSNDVQFAAGQAGGKRRHKKTMRGGTTSRGHMGMASPLAAALNAA